MCCQTACLSKLGHLITKISAKIYTSILSTENLRKTVCSQCKAGLKLTEQVKFVTGHAFFFLSFSEHLHPPARMHRVDLFHITICLTLVCFRSGTQDITAVRGKEYLLIIFFIKRAHDFRLLVNHKLPHFRLLTACLTKMFIHKSLYISISLISVMLWFWYVALSILCKTSVIIIKIHYICTQDV